MAKKQEILIEIDQNGKITGDVLAGPGGAGCLSMLDEVLKGIGDKESSAVKPEMYQVVGTAKTTQGVKR